MHFTLAELANRVGGRVEGDGSIRIERILPLEEAGPSDISFFANRRYAAEFAATRAGGWPGSRTRDSVARPASRPSSGPPG